MDADRNFGYGFYVDLPSAQRLTEWRLAESVTLRVISVYRDTFGSLDTLFGEGALQVLPQRSPADIVAELTLSDLSLLTGTAMRHLAAEGNCASGRKPLKLVDWNVILYSLSSARTLRQGIVRCIECFEAIDWRCGKMDLRVQGTTAILELDAMRPPRKSIGDCLVDLFGVTEIHGLFGWLIGRSMEVDQVMLNHCGDVFSMLKLPDLPFAITVDAGWTGFEFDAAYLDHPVVRSMEEVETRPRRNLLFAGNAEAKSRRVSDQVRKIALRALRDLHKLPSFEEIVSTTLQSEATLRRRLAREGTSFRQIRESCRRELAFDMLQRTTIPIEEVSSRLDYCDSDAFRLAFRNWVGTTPSEYRENARVDPFKTGD